MITLYAVIWRADAPTLDETGWSCSRTATWPWSWARRPGHHARDDALSYGRTVEQVAAAVDVLPFRYGTTVADADEARRTAARARLRVGCAAAEGGGLRRARDPAPLRRRRTRSARSRARST